MATILAIDDDRDILVIVEQTLKAGGHRVVTTSDPASAPALAAENAVDAVVLDIQMPDLSGFDVLRALRSQAVTGGVPILFLSALSDSRDRIRGLREGADDFLNKPFAPEELKLRIDRLLGQRSGIHSEPSVPTPAELEDKLADRRVLGQVFMGRYKVLEVVGEGAMGVVFRGWDPKLKRPVALKTLRFEKLSSERDRTVMVSRLLEEAITGARFNHPNIVAVYDVAGGHQSAFIAMEYVDGVSLESYLEDHGKLPPEQAIPLALGIASGLAGAHEHRIVHRDVKPGNVLLGVRGSIKVTDFGVAQLISALSAEEGRLFGTPGYLPPEALRNEGHEEAGDLFGLGVTLYQSLTGEKAFRGENFHQRMISTMNDEVPPPSTRAPEIPELLDRLIMELLEKQPKDRPSSAREVVERLAAMGGRELVWEPRLEPGRRRRVPSAASGEPSVLVAPLEG